MIAVFRILHRHRALIVLALVLLFVAVIRLRLREMPLERDEGEYAYAGQLLLQGIPPYKLAYNMKFPGIYGAYALVMLLFGQTAAGIRAGLLLVNAASIVLVFFLGRKLLDLNGGLVAATTFAVLSLSASVLGLAAHASHFVVLAALGGTLLLLRVIAPLNPRGEKDPSPLPSTLAKGSGGIAGSPTSNARPGRGGPLLLGLCFASGACFGIAFLMKQPGILWAVFGLLYLAWVQFEAPLQDLLAQRRRVSPAQRGRQQRTRLQPGATEDPSPRPSPLLEGRGGVGSSHAASLPGSSGQPWKRGLVRCLWYSLGFIMPPLLMCLFLWRAGVFDRFMFWTFTYAKEYASLYPLFTMPTEHFRAALSAVFGPNLTLWILALLGMVVMWWDERLYSRRWFLGGFVVCSLLAVVPGWYLRQHYFIFLLPAAALLMAIAFNRGLYLLMHDRTIELFLAVPILGLLPLGLGAAVVGNASVWFGMAPVAACREIYPRQMFAENAELGAFIRDTSTAGARIAVLGSEPEIYFYARRHSATGYLYVYPLTEPHKYARKMQEEMIREIESVKPEYLVFVNVKESWMARGESEQQIFQWYEQYSKANYDLIRMLHEKVEKTNEGDPQLADRAPGYLLLYQRKNSGK